MNTPRRGLIIDFNSIAALLAHEDANVQGAFLNTFAKELYATCETRHAAEMQATFIRGILSSDAKEVCETLCWKETP
jgi:hypothetical protein